MTRPSALKTSRSVEPLLLLCGLGLAVWVGVASYQGRGHLGTVGGQRLHRVYDPDTRQLTGLLCDTDGDDLVDTSISISTDGQVTIERLADGTEAADR